MKRTKPFKITPTANLIRCIENTRSNEINISKHKKTENDCSPTVIYQIIQNPPFANRQKGDNSYKKSAVAFRSNRFVKRNFKD